MGQCYEMITLQLPSPKQSAGGKIAPFVHVVHHLLAFARLVSLFQENGHFFRLYLGHLNPQVPDC